MEPCQEMILEVIAVEFQEFKRRINRKVQISSALKAPHKIKPILSGDMARWMDGGGHLPSRRWQETEIQG